MAESLTTDRLKLRKPEPADAASIFDGFASDPEVTRYLSWPTHDTVADTLAFIDASAEEWAHWGAGPLLIESRDAGAVIGATGLSFETPLRASTGYVIAHGGWGKGYATEALDAVVDQAVHTGLWRIEAMCHHAHARSARVLEKAGFDLEGRLARHTVFPNLGTDEPQDVLLYARILDRRPT